MCPLLVACIKRLEAPSNTPSTCRSVLGSSPCVEAQVNTILAKGEWSKAQQKIDRNGVADQNDPIVIDDVKARMGKKRVDELPGFLNFANGQTPDRIKINTRNAYQALKRLKASGP
ncbi:hypothetical protein TrCOL_g9429, partial [Triparma columacea]